jgi:hypothetical protein
MVACPTESTVDVSSGHGDCASLKALTTSSTDSTYLVGNGLEEYKKWLIRLGLTQICQDAIKSISAANPQAIVRVNGIIGLEAWAGQASDSVDLKKWESVNMKKWDEVFDNFGELDLKCMSVKNLMEELTSLTTVKGKPVTFPAASRGQASVLCRREHRPPADFQRHLYTTKIPDKSSDDDSSSRGIESFDVLSNTDSKIIVVSNENESFPQTKSPVERVPVYKRLFLTFTEVLQLEAFLLNFGLRQVQSNSSTNPEFLKDLATGYLHPHAPNDREGVWMYTILIKETW